MSDPTPTCFYIWTALGFSSWQGRRILRSFRVWIWTIYRSTSDKRTFFSLSLTISSYELKLFLTSRHSSRLNFTLSTNILPLCYPSFHAVDTLLDSCRHDGQLELAFLHWQRALDPSRMAGSTTSPRACGTPFCTVRPID